MWVVVGRRGSNRGTKAPRLASESTVRCAVAATRLVRLADALLAWRLESSTTKWS